MGKFISIIVLLLMYSISFSQTEFTDIPVTIPDSLAYSAITVGAKADVDIFMTRFTTPFNIISQDFDNTLTLACSQPFKVRYYEEGKTPIKMWKIIYVQIRNMRIVGKKLEIIEQSMR